MDYQKHYNLLIEKAKNRTKPDVYCEGHHIIPKCLKGKNNKENIVSLTAREHFVSHWLLHRMYPDSHKLSIAFYAMTQRSGNNKTMYRYIPSSRAIAEARENGSKAISIKRKEYWTEEKRKEQSIRFTEYRKNNKIDNWCKGQTKETNKTVLLISEKLKGKPSGMKGKVAWNKGLPAWNKGKKLTTEQLENSHWIRVKIECEICGRKIGINNIKKHIKNHELN